jgi:hypothetical protein
VGRLPGSSTTGGKIGRYRTKKPSPVAGIPMMAEIPEGCPRCPKGGRRHHPHPGAHKRLGRIGLEGRKVVAAPI